MPETPKLSDAKRALLEKYLHGDQLHLPATAGDNFKHTQKNIGPLSPIDLRVPVVTVQNSGTKRPFFYIHVHEEGGAFYCFHLARVLGPDQPFYVLDPYKFDDPNALPTLEVMAAAYIESMRTIQPEGPYLLAGFCGGGLIGYEMSQQLLAEGQTVDLLLLIEPVDGPAPLKYIAPRLTSSFVRGIGSLFRLSPGQQLDFFLYLRHWPRLRHAEYRNFPNFSLFPIAKTLRQEWLSLFVWVISAYSPQQYSGKVSYIWASKNPAKFRAWWGKLAQAREVEMHVTHGTHDSCRTEYIQEMAEHIRLCVNKAQADASSERP